MKKSRKAREIKETPAPVAAPQESPLFRLAAVGVVSLLLAVCPFLPVHPFGWLPPVLFIPLYGTTILGLWFFVAGDRAWPRPAPRVADVVFEAGALTLVFGSFLLLKLVGLHPSGTDDNIYYYMAHRMTDGALPYRDFFFSHPPVHLLVPATVFSITGFSIGVAKTIPALAQAVAGLMMYLACRRASKPFAGLVLLFHLTAYQVLMGSTDMNGENLMSAFLAAGLFAAMRKRFLVAGALAGLGLGCGLYALAFVLALAVASATVSRNALFRFGIGVAASFGVVMAVFWIIGGAAFLDGVLWYHLAKPVKGEDRIPIFGTFNPFTMVGALFHNLGVYLKGGEFKKSLYFHAPAYVAAAIGLAMPLVRVVAVWWRNDKSDEKRKGIWAVLTPRDMLDDSAMGLMKFGGLAVLLFLLQWSALNEIYDFYTVPMMIVLALPAAFAVERMFAVLRDASRPRDFGIGLVPIALFCLHMPMAAALNRNLWPEEQATPDAVVTYEWREPWALSGLSGLTRALFFEDSRRRGDVTPYYRHYVWNKMLTFSVVDDIAEYVRQNSEPEDTLMGASTLAPLVALYADRRISADEADTNAKRFKANQTSDREMFEKACADRVKFVVSASRSHYDERFMAQDPTIQAWFVRDRDFMDPQLIHFRGFPITLYKRVDKTGKAPGTVCEAR